MLRIIIEGEEGFNEETNEFIPSTDDLILELEHSLLSLSKWESKYQKPFLSAGKKTTDEIFGYLKAMVVTPNVDPGVLSRLSQKDIDKIQEYIDSSQSATTFGVMPERRGPGEVITSELIYYWIVSFNIPFECQTWHLNRLFALIRICNIKNSKPKKMSRHELAMRNRELNAKRREALGTSG
jgi:hypothetical protein